VLALFVCIITLGDIFFKMISVEKAYGQFSKEVPANHASFIRVGDIYGERVGWYLDIQKFIEEYRKITGLNIDCSIRKEQVNDNIDHSIYKFTFDDSASFTMEDSLSSGSLQQPRFMLYKMSLKSLWKEDFADSFGAGVESIITAIHNSMLTVGTINHLPEISFDVKIFIATLRLGVVRYIVSPYPYLTSFEPNWSEQFSNDSSKIRDELQKMKRLAVYTYITDDSLKAFIVPYETYENLMYSNFLLVENRNRESASAAHNEISAASGGILRITVAASFLQDKKEGIHLTNINGTTLHVDLPENFQYIPGSTTQTYWTNDGKLEESLPDGIVTSKGLPMGTIMPDDGVKYVTFLVQVNPFKELFEKNNQANITARVASGDNEIEQSVTINVIV
jgi:hypothetical protein